MSNNVSIFNMLSDSLSQPRMMKYLIRANWSKERAVNLYLHNSQLAQAFLFPLEITEVVVRNAIDKVLVDRFGENWHRNSRFVDDELNERSRENLQTAFGRARSGSREKIIAALTFDFWANLFRPEYWAFWGNSIYGIFPNMEKGEYLEKDLEYIQSLLTDINKFRNRVAHHEPVYHMNIERIYSRMIKLTSLKCPDTASWMEKQSAVLEVLRSRPR